MEEWRSSRYREARGWKEVDRRGRYGGRTLYTVHGSWRQGLSR
jgi:hypothetical protein